MKHLLVTSLFLTAAAGVYAGGSCCPATTSAEAKPAVAMVSETKISEIKSSCEAAPAIATAAVQTSSKEACAAGEAVAAAAKEGACDAKAAVATAAAEVKSSDCCPGDKAEKAVLATAEGEKAKDCSAEGCPVSAATVAAK